MIDEILSSRFFHNHIKLGLAFLLTRDTLEEFVQKDHEEFTKEVLEDIYVNFSVPKGTKCGNCQISNVLKCPTAEICNIKDPEKCSIHKGSSNKFRHCTENICNHFKDKIVARHRGQPVWRYTDTTKWCSDPAEVAKCFMPPQGYEGIASLQEADFHGIISIIINNKRFQNKLKVNLSKKANLCIEIRSRSNDYRHSPRLSTDDTVLIENIDLLITLLEDPKYLFTDQSSQNAVKALQQLKNDTFEVSSKQISRVLTEEIQVREKAAVKNISEHERQTIAHLHILRQRLSEESKTITANSLAEMAECTRKQMASIEKTSFKEQRKLQRKAKQLRNSFNKEDEHHADEGHRLSGEAETEHDKKFKDELRNHLIKLYLNEHKYLPISPVTYSNRAPLLEYYVSPTMYYIDIDRQPFRNEESRFTNHVNSYDDIFRKGDKECQNIYVTSPAGNGKTCFTKRMTLTWCQTWKPEDSVTESFQSEDIKVMKDFNFFFLISLRQCRSNECHIEEMIKNQLLSKLPEQFQASDIIERLLDSEKCLIVIDGLDEWSHPTKKKKKCPQFSSKIPHRKLRLTSTFLTTTRRWKFHTVSQENVPMDQHIELMGLDKKSSDMLAKKVVSNLNSRSDQMKSHGEFAQVLETKGLQKFTQFPLMLMQLICLWYDGKDLGESKCQLFSNMLELLFTHASNRANFGDKYKTIPHRKGKRSGKLLPSCFKTAPMCRKYRQVLFSLSKLSYETLFGETFDNSLVFDQTVVDRYLTEVEFSLCIEIGILLKTKQVGQLTSEEFNYSFLHKTFQELLAAVFISSKTDLPNNMIPKVMKKIRSIDGILRMDMFLIFLSGLSPTVLTSLTHEFAPLISNEEMTARYRRNIGTIFIKDNNIMHGLSDLMISCVQESTSSQLDCTVYLEDVFVDVKCLDGKYRSAMSKVIEANKENINSLYIHIHQTVPSESIGMIMKDVNVGSVRSLLKLFVWGCVDSCHVESLLNNSATTLKCLEMWNQDFRPEYLNEMLKMKYLHGLSVMSVSMTHSQIDDLMLCISRNQLLKQLILNKIMCSDHKNECPGYTLRFCTDAKPHLLLLDKLHVTEVSVNAECLQTCIAELLYKSGALVSLLKRLPNASNLLRLECDAPVDEPDTECLISTVPELKKLIYFRLRNVDLTLFQKRLNLSNMKNLMRIHIWHTSLTADIFKGIVEDSESLENQLIVILDNCKILPEEEAEAVKKYVKTSSKFEVIWEKEGKYPQFHFKTNAPSPVLNLLQ